MTNNEIKDIMKIITSLENTKKVNTKMQKYKDKKM